MESCIICLEDIDCDFYITKCNHKFHLNCLNKWYKYKNNCPICRSDINIYSKYWLLQNLKNELLEFASDVLHAFLLGISNGLIPFD